MRWPLRPGGAFKSLAFRGLEAVTPGAIKFVAVIYRLSLTVAVIYKLSFTVAVIYKLSLTVAIIYKQSLTCRHLHADHSGTLPFQSVGTFFKDVNFRTPYFGIYIFFSGKFLVMRCLPS